MQISPETKIMARVNKTASSRGIAPYNNYFVKSNTNAICLELHNPQLNILLDGMKSLNFRGAITVAFEYDTEIFNLVNEIDPICHKTNAIGFITQRNGKITGHTQGGWGLKQALEEKTNLENKKIVIFGAGHMTKGLLAELEHSNIYPVIEIYNRTVCNAESIGKQFPFVKKVGSLLDFEKSNGDILINTSTIGSPWNKGGDYLFGNKMIANFNIVADVNFVPLKTPLIEMADHLGKITVPGWQTFKFGTTKCFQTILDITVDTNTLGEELVNDFTHNWS